METRYLAIAFLEHTRSNKDHLYLFDIANTHGCIGEHIENWLKL